MTGVTDMQWKIVRAIGIVGTLIVASAAVIGNIIWMACQPEPYEKKKEDSDGRHDSSRVP